MHHYLFLYAAAPEENFTSFLASNITKIKELSKGFQTNNTYRYSLCIIQACYALLRRVLHIPKKTKTFQKSVMRQMINIKQYNRLVHKLLSIIIKLSLLPLLLSISCSFLILYFCPLPRASCHPEFCVYPSLFKKIAWTSKQYIVLVSFG